MQPPITASMPAPEIAVAPRAADRFWILAGASVGALSGFIVGLLFVASWCAFMGETFSGFVGVPLVLATGIPAIVGGAGMLIVAASAADSATRG